MKRFLVTRPVEDAQKTADALRRRGYEVSIIPLMQIQFHSDVTFGDMSPYALLISSANGIRAFARLDNRRDIKVMTVGEASAAEACALGFVDVESAQGDVDSLVRLVTRRVDRQAGQLCHVAGSTIAGRLVEDLEAAGFAVVRRVAYATVENREAGSMLGEQLLDDTAPLHGALFFSPRTSDQFARLIQRRGLEHRCSQIAAYCLSEAAAAPLTSLPLRRIHVAPEKSQSALLDLCDME